MIDECHILWGDILGYAWGKTDERIEIVIKNETGLTYCFYMWCIFDNPDPIFTLQLVFLRKS